MVSALWQSLGFFVVLMAELAVLFIVVSVLAGGGHLRISRVRAGGDVGRAVGEARPGEVR